MDAAEAIIAFRDSEAALDGGTDRRDRLVEPALPASARRSRRLLIARLRLQHWEAEAPNAIMGWTVFQPRREQWTRQRYQSLRSRPPWHGAHPGR